jgi:two-component system phosphate regulon sensor histidine kinase PhoR
MGYRRIILLLVYLGIVPGVLLSAIGVLLLVMGEARLQLLMGILVLTFTATLVTGVILAWVFLRRERNLSELQSDFVSKVSHELRTPLTSIRMFSETLVLRRGDKVAEDRCIQALDKESARLNEIIGRLLDWGRMESGARTYRLEAHHARDLVEDAVSAFGPTRERTDVDVEMDVPAELPPVYVDRPAIVDALVNLLSNAYKYSDPPRLIRVAAGVSGDKRLRLTVRDNGKGIARREHRRIFEKFYRVDDLLTRREAGSGLGLAIVKHVVKGHGGKIAVESVPGKGSEFIILLPTEPPKKRPIVEPKASTSSRPPRPALEGSAE